MRDFISCLRRDISIGMFFSAPFLFLAVWIVAVESGMGAEAIAHVSESGASLSVLSVFGFVFEGVPPVEQGAKFVLPLSWFASMLVIVLPSCLYPSYDFKCRRCSQILVRTSRSAWWWSKLVWSIASWGASFACLLTASAVAGFLLSVNSDIPIDGRSGTLSVSLFYIALSSFCVSLLACVFSLVLGSVATACVVVVFLVASAYFSTPFLFANYAMLERISTGLIPLPPWPIACLLAFVMCGVAVFIGYAVYIRGDYLE